MGERRSRNLLVQLGPKMQAYPEELIRQRRSYDGLAEYLIRWNVLTVDNSNSGSGSGGGSGSNGSHSSSSDNKVENILMWMSVEDVYANCPTLLGKRKLESQRPKEEQEPSAGSCPSGPDSDVTFDDVELLDMKEDVKLLVERARRQMSRKCGADSSLNISHTIHVLSAYASIGSLVGVFKETGALDVLMELLCNKETQTRRSAGKMLRALASHDAGSRAYVLLSLSQQDGIEQHMDFDNRYTLLELFAETTSSEEHGISFEGIHLPQIPGKLLFSLVKRYLCVTSLMDKLNNSGQEAGGERQDCNAPHVPEQTRILREFEFTLAMANLISELVRVMGWDRNRHPEPGESEMPRNVKSIFQPRSLSISSVLAPQPRKKSAATYKTRSNFSSRSSYVEYVQENLKAGMTVKMLEDYEQVNAGDEGEFRFSNDGTPPVQVFWHQLNRTYWVHWHMIEIIEDGWNGQVDKESQEKASSLTENLKLTTVTQTFFHKPPGGLYSLPYLSDNVAEDSSTLSRAEWWEVLFFIKKLEPKQQQEAVDIIHQSLEEQVSVMDESALIQLTVPVELAQKLLQFVGPHCPAAYLTDLESSHVYIKHYLRRRGLGLDHLSGTLAGAEYGSPPGTAGSSSSSSTSSASLSKETKKEIPPDPTSPGLSSGRTDTAQAPEMGRMEELELPDDLEEKLKEFSCPKVSGRKTSLEKIGEVVEMMKKSSSDISFQVAGFRFITKMLEEDSSRDKLSLKVDSGLNHRDKLIKAVVEQLSSLAREKVLVVTCFRLLYILMQRYDWRVLFATEGGIKAVLSCMQEHRNSALVQQAALATLKILTGASKYDMRSKSVRPHLAEADAQIILEIFASIGSASTHDSKGLLSMIPAAVEKMMNTSGCSSAVQDGLLVVIMLVSNHKSLAELLVSCNICPILYSCIGTGSRSTGSLQQMLAIMALSNISLNHKLSTGIENKESKEALNLKDAELKMLLVSLKERNGTKEIILSLERWVCDETTGLETQIADIMTDKEAFQSLVQGLNQFRSEKLVQQAIIRILNKFLDNYQEDLLPWHESIEPCLSSMTAFSNDREVLQDFIRFLYGLATVNKDYAVVMCRLGSKETLSKALDKHSATLPLAAELRDLVGDCEKYASLYKKMTTSILAGCIQMVLGQIEEHRRSHQPINIPFFHVFLRNLCQGLSERLNDNRLDHGSGVELKEDKCWEKIEVSSNHHRTSKLTDKNPKSYWESNGSTGSHYINIYMHKGVVIRQLTLLVASEDSSYMPARVVVMGGDDPSNINTELNTVNVAPTANRVLLLENMTRYWSIIQIRIKRCQQGGIDTRVHGFEVLGPKPTFWPVFKEQLCCRTYLFYTTKAHTWCQEILEDRMQLLQLFNKLNSALRHEQMFADRFLPDAEASEALGRTCWEALINPIVQSITTLGNADPSPLTWLLTEYLENSDNSKRGKGRAVIFNSRVRRLCHLLVHVDTSRNEVEELKPAIKSDGKDKSKDGGSSSTSGKGQPRSKPGSIAGIAQCWHAVVQQQVKHFLDGAWNSTDFVQRYRNMYLRLKNAMEELFGQQTAFVLALRKGFSGGLLQLSHLTAMHVSERFAQYIDQRIQESGADASSVETLNQLQQFLEPMLFFSGLELANIFEHFYRYYLGDRLLGQGKVWLERAIIDQIGSCFPGRFPQQMLKNLSESNELQQEFHLYRLQQLDKKLENMDDEVMEEVEMPLAEPETELAVLVLSPRCWSISLCHLENPARYFPPDLSDFLEEFSDFYTSSQSVYGFSSTKPRRLQWTWLGHAVLSYGSLTLHVSTLQMYILLLFNQQEEIAVETILRLTGLSLVLVQHALKPLIEEDGILSHTQTEQSQFKAVLRLNGEALERGSVVSQCYTLLPKQTYLNVDEDAASALDRKRNVIYCIIVQIMKSEKELHIDNLVFKVIDRCQSQETSAAQRFLQFSCSNMDVLCCIMHLINEGYVRRNEDNPHILEYVLEDPITPRKGQAHIMFRKPGSKGSESNNGKENLSVFSFDCSTTGGWQSSECGVLETVLLSMGRTMSQEEVQQLMSQTVLRVADTLSVSADIAQNLLIHSKWNVDLLVQRYAEDPDTLLLAAGLQVRNPQAPSNPVTQCPVCLNQLPEDSEPNPTLCCLHYCCRSCWKEYLTTRIEQNLVLNCTCPISDCPAQPTHQFISSIISDRETVAKYSKTLLRGYVECCSNLTWCTNPQGCDQIVCKEGIGSVGTCSKCCWSSCFSCNFPEAHYPASCSHMSQWMDDGGYYEGMTVEAQSKHLAKLISKRCPSCHAQIEKNEGCLHMTCAKCNHGFCWRCLKPWKPTHKDYYNCSAMVSKAARQEKRFHDYNDRCTFHHQARDFAINLEGKVAGVNEALQMKCLTFVIDACKMLAQSHKVLAYSCVYSYYNQDTEKMDIMEQQTENLELHTNALQILLEETLLQCTDLASCIRLLKPEHLNTGLELIRRILERLLAILQHSTQDFRVGFQPKQGADQNEVHPADLSNTVPADPTKEVKSGSQTEEDDGENEEDYEEEDDEYVPEWQDTYDEDEDIDEEDFSDDASENLERDFFYLEDGDVYD
ncbi:cullin-9 isoform X1 [Callorhinchus milii]|uniref:cullin-9 isoform X1 n=1 Tax=Callorhinchus milii TaxID=7868 RepID=UPI001C3FE942|nr:cullin-9 isoform X1 [Callorhinchus milii]